MSNLLKQVAEPQLDDTPFTWIYALVDPRNNAIRYIGKANNPKQRFAVHLVPSNLKNKTHKTAWINQLLNLGLKPKLETLDWVPVSEWPTEEKKWIARFRNLPGPKLTNTTDGGEGSAGLVFTEEQKQRISERMKGRKAPPGTGAKISAALKGRIRTAKHCENLSIGQKKRAQNLSDEEKKKIRNRPARGKSKYRGVSKATTGSWQAGCKTDSGYEYIGVFATEEESAHERDIFVINNFGPDWPLNFPIEDYSDEEISNRQQRTVGMFNTNNSGFRGVSWRRAENKWNCFVSEGNKCIGLGLFPGTEEGKIAAARIFDMWVIQHRGPTAYTNFPRSKYTAQEIENACMRIPRRADNKSGFIGVSWEKVRHLWKCSFAYKGRPFAEMFPGTDQGKIDAAHAYDRLAIQHKGQLARTNFPHSHYPDLLPPTP